jgi:hypothetical protein
MYGYGHGHGYDDDDEEEHITTKEDFDDMIDSEGWEDQGCEIVPSK